MKSLFVIALVIGFTAPVFAAKIEFNTMIESALNKQKGLDHSMKALIDASQTANSDEKQVLEFLEAEIEYGKKDSKVAEKYDRNEKLPKNY